MTISRFLRFGMHTAPRARTLRHACLLPLLALTVTTGCEGEPPKADDSLGAGPVNSPVDPDADPVPDAVYDLDHDGYTSDVDCDDNDWAIHPDAEELCDGKDNDCDASIDEGWDADGDGFLPFECDGGDDCDDANASVNPGADDVPYDGIDQDCDGVDNLDADGDGFNALEVGGNDCDDTLASVYPGAEEVAKDGVDQDCDGFDLLDGDGDGFDDQDFGGTDCNDSDATIFPDAWEWMNDGVDSDCDGTDGREVDMTEAEVVFSGSSASNDYLGFSIVHCDFDADGVEDLVISAPLSSGALGRVGIFMGASAENWSTAGSLDDADIIITGDEVAFGMGLACGDIDGDGLVDLVAGSGEYYYYDADFTMSVWYGASGWTAEMSQAEADAHLEVDLGGTSSATSIYALDFSLADLDADGMDDLLVNAAVPEGLSSGSDPDGALWLIPGGTWAGTYLADDVVTRRISPDVDGAVTGFKVIDDWNGDGLNELVLEQGAYTSDVSGPEYQLGRVSFLSGWPSADGQAADLAFASVEGSNGFDSGFGIGSEFADFTNDGAMDFLGCGPYVPYSTRTNSGACYLFDDVASDLTATGLPASTYADNSVVSGYQDGMFGVYTSLVPDVNGDGVPEVLAVEPGGGTGARGRSMILNGAEMAAAGGFPDDVALAEFTHVNNYSMVSSTRAIGDFDGDGHTDFVFGALGYGLTSSSGGYFQGRVWVWMSSKYLGQ
jgi:hypothetical protein